MFQLSTIATLALFLSSSVAPAYALPTASSAASSSSTITGQVPTVANLQGLVDPHLFRRNLHQTFAKYQFAPVRGGGGNATSTLTLKGTTTTTTSPQSSMMRRALQKKKRGEEQDLPTRIASAVITREPAIGLVRADFFFFLALAGWRRPGKLEPDHTILEARSTQRR